MLALSVFPASVVALVALLIAISNTGSTTKRKSSYRPVAFKSATTFANWFVGASTIKSPYADNLADALKRDTSKFTYAVCARSSTSSCTPRLSAAAI